MLSTFAGVDMCLRSRISAVLLLFRLSYTGPQLTIN